MQETEKLITLYVPAPIQRQLKKLAEKRGIPMKEIAGKVLENYLDDWEKQEGNKIRQEVENTINALLQERRERGKSMSWVVKACLTRHPDINSSELGVLSIETGKDPRIVTRCWHESQRNQLVGD